MTMSKTPAASTRSSSRTVRERQLVLIDDPRQYLKSVDAHELQVDDDWEERLNLQVKIMYVKTRFLAFFSVFWRFMM